MTSPESRTEAGEDVEVYVMHVVEEAPAVQSVQDVGMESGGIG